MPRWTEEQQLAIMEDGKNIIVSAGAGSGKTAVLSERVIRKLEDGVHVDELLLLTFTKAAAFEMMIRIRDKIKKKENLKEELSRIDSSYITTFDSFSLSLVKKYHYLLNINPNVKIINQIIIDLKQKEIIDNIFDNYYETENKKFLNLIDSFTLKDDKNIKDYIITMNNKLDLKYDKIDYLNKYISNCNDDFINDIVDIFNKYIFSKINQIKDTLSNISLGVDGDYYSKLEDMLSFIINARNYDDLVNKFDFRLPNLPKGLDEDIKLEKEKLSNLIKELKNICIYESINDIKNNLKNSNNYVEIIIDIILKLDKEINEFKKLNDAYTFTDIAKMAISLVQNNLEIREEMKNKFNEIMIDEYQDTSDLQELFISLISNNNVYMVGDIKQSIYRFRNANPYIFKNKYDKYGKGDGGFKIDLMKNFRSRYEVLDNINYIFNPIMDDLLGGCRYKEEHQMVFGNTNYTENKMDISYDIEVLNYKYDKELGYKKDEIEIFTIIKDIKDKINSGYQVVDKETGKLRNIEYSDFAILMDRASKFELYKKIFEYYQIPMQVYKDTSISTEDDIYIIRHLLRLVRFIKNNDLKEDFRYSYMSIARSYLCSINDNEIFNIISNNLYKETELYKNIEEISINYNKYSIIEILNQLIDKFDFYHKQILVSGIDNLIAKIDYIKDVFQEMLDLGFDNDAIIDQFDIIIEEEYDIKVNFSSGSQDGVKIMTIHKSKGLEFPILYLSGLANKFNISDLNEKFIYDNEFGFILPFYNEKESDNIMKILLRDRFLKEEIGEKIRLFYVALTRAKEKMIFITNIEDNDNLEVDFVDNNIRLKYLSFLDIIKSIWANLLKYVKDVNIDELGLSHDYNFIKESNFEETINKECDKLKYRELVINDDIEIESKFSKNVKELFTNDQYNSIEFGKRMHEIFESIDFKNPDLSELSDYEKDKVNKFLNLDIFNNEILEVYKEYEFIYQIDNEKKHGFIDLMLEYEDKFIIIDYKLKNINDTEYNKQLNGYKEYIKSKSSKDVYIYLYSIMESNLKSI